MKNRLVVITLLLFCTGRASEHTFHRTPGFHGGLFVSASVEDGELSGLLHSSVDFFTIRGFLLHSGVGVEHRLSSYTHLVASAGAGYILRSGHLGIPLWGGAGVSTTGLWGHRLNRPFVTAGTGVRVRFDRFAGLGIGVEAALHDRGLWDNRLLVGFVFMWERNASPVH